MTLVALKHQYMARLDVYNTADFSDRYAYVYTHVFKRMYTCVCIYMCIYQDSLFGDTTYIYNINSLSVQGRAGKKKLSPSSHAKISAEALVRSGGENAKLSICQAESSRHYFFFAEEATVRSWINIFWVFSFSTSGQASDTSLYQHAFTQVPHTAVHS